jgi:hypothetical protein
MQSVSTNNGESVLNGMTATPSTSKSSIIIEVQS